MQTKLTLAVVSTKKKKNKTKKPFTECGGQKNGPNGYLSSPNHPRPYPHHQVHLWLRDTHQTGHNVCVCVFHSSYVLFPISCAYGMCLLRRVTSSHWASGTSAWRLRMCVSLITWRCTTASILELGECWEGETRVHSNCHWGLKKKKKCHILWELYNHSVLKQLVCLRFCGTTFPPDLTSSGPHMTVVFVADEGVADSGFNATYQAVSVLDSEFLLL